MELSDLSEPLASLSPRLELPPITRASLRLQRNGRLSQVPLSAPCLTTADFGLKSGGDMTSLKGDRKQNFLIHLLGHQQFDGSFEFATDREFIRLLVQDTFDAVASLVDHTLSRSLYFTIAVIVVLERHFAPEKQLWHMVHSKASTYIKGAPGRATGHDMEAFRDGLRDIRSPLDQASLALEQKDRKPSRQATYSKASEYAKQAAKRLRKIFRRGQADKDPQSIQDDQIIAPGRDGLEDPQKSDPVTRQARRVIEIAPSD
uniref:Uncharacterized protein n=1 Tax=Bionectria ochroleuca TaxID=29856 RepID=A0A8H7ND06_BIOOC